MPTSHASQDPEYLKVEEVAARLKVQERTVRDWILRGELRAYKIGKEWRTRRDHFDEAMEARLVTGEPAPTGGLWDRTPRPSVARIASRRGARSAARARSILGARRTQEGRFRLG